MTCTETFATECRDSAVTAVCSTYNIQSQNNTISDLPRQVKHAKARPTSEILDAWEKKATIS